MSGYVLRNDTQFWPLFLNQIKFDWQHSYTGMIKKIHYNVCFRTQSRKSPDTNFQIKFIYGIATKGHSKTYNLLLQTIVLTWYL